MEPQDIYHEVLVERARQDKKWGKEHDDMHNTYAWVAIIVGQLGKIISPAPSLDWHPNFRKQMIRVAAVAFAALEWLDR